MSAAERPAEILIIEDSAPEALALSRLLERHGYQVTTVDQGQHALQLLELRSFDAIISDVDMPGLDGFSMTAAVKKDPRWREIPIILLTRLSDPEFVVHGLEARADLFLTKPFSSDYLVDQLRTVLQQPHRVAYSNDEKNPVIFVGGKRFEVQADRLQILTLLLSTYENAVHQNQELNKAQAALKQSNQDLHKQSRRLRISESNFRSLVEHQMDAMVVIDSGGEVQFVNPPAVTLFQKPERELLGRPFQFQIVPNTSQEVELPSADGSVRILELRVFETIWNGSGGYLAAFRDVSERKAAERKIQEQQLELIEANRKLAALATLDGLTGLTNHRVFKETLAEEVQRARRYQLPLSLIVADVDHFKSYNDSFGHPAGDDVLKAAGRLLQRVARATDLVARYGGEEFAVILPNTTAAQAAEVAERLRVAVASAAWPNRMITLSLGVAQWHLETATAAALISEADKALYMSKKAGRNRVTIQEPGNSAPSASAATSTNPPGEPSPVPNL